MKAKIRRMEHRDKDAVFSMMKVFYASPAVFTDGSDEIFLADIDGAIGDNPYIEGFVFEIGEDICGYGMIAKSFSTEFGKPCIWVEDLYIKEGYRGLGIGKDFLDLITESYEGHVFRLEVEEENENAVRLYRRCGFTPLPYLEMKK